MKPKHVIIVLFVLILFQGTLFTGTPLTATSGRQPVTNTGIQSPFHTSGAGGENPLITNVIRGGDFETSNLVGAPDYWGYWGTCYAKTNLTYTAFTHSGIYCGEVEAKGTQQWSGTGELEYSEYPSPPNSPYLVAGLNMTLFTDVLSCPDLANGARVEVYIQTYSPYHALHYCLSYSSSWNPSNDSYHAYFMLNQSIGSWQKLSRNITADYVTRFGTPAASCYVGYTEWIPYSPNNPTGLTTILGDDYSLTNRTAYNYVTNGNFESGDGSHWYSHSSRSPASVTLTADRTEGSSAANLTARAMGSNSWGYADLDASYSHPYGLYASEPGTGILSFDWKYTDTHNGGYGQGAYLFIYARNLTYNVYLCMYMGYDLDDMPYGNFSYAGYTYVYIKASGFGNRGAWQHEVIDLRDLSQKANFTDFDVVEFYFEVDVGTNANSSVTLLLDRFVYLTYPTIDPGFEQDWSWSPSNPVPSWLSTGAGYPYANLTPLAHSGKWAANLTAYGYVNTGLYRSTYVSIDKSVYTDFWYQVQSSTSAGASSAYIVLDFNDYAYSVTYLLAGSGGYSITNDSGSVYFYVDRFNETGTWKELVRNVKADLEATFAPTGWYLDRVEIYCYGEAGGKMSVIFDEMNFVADTHAPIFSYVGLTGPAPMYYSQASVRIELTDLSPVATAIYYDEGAGWVQTLATNAGSYYLAHIPEGPYGTGVRWYVNATDSVGHITIDNNHGIYYSYVIGDDIAPVIESITPINHTVVSGWNTVNVSATDPGVGSSGVSHVELWYGSTLLANTSSAPYRLRWNTFGLANGNYTLTVKVMDNAGMPSTGLLYVSVQNGFGSFIDTYGLLIGAGVVVFVFAAAMILHSRRAAKTPQGRKAAK